MNISVRKMRYFQVLAECALKATDYSKFVETLICDIYNIGINKSEEGIIMNVEIKIDASYKEPKIIIVTASMTDDVNNIVKQLSDNGSQIIAGYKDEKVEILEQADLIRIYSSSGKVFAVADKGEYILKLRLYELENKLLPAQFIRISNSEIINLKKVNNFDFGFTGTICVKLSNGTTTYVSRRYVSKLKKILGI